MTIEQAESLAHDAYYGIYQGLPPELVMDVHKALYDGGILFLNEIKEELNNNPDGAFARLVRDLIMARSGEYKTETLEKMYGFKLK